MLVLLAPDCVARNGRSAATTRSKRLVMNQKSGALSWNLLKTYSQGAVILANGLHCEGNCSIFTLRD